MPKFFSKNKTLLKQIVLGDIYANNIWSYVNCAKSKQKQWYHHCCLISSRKVEVSLFALLFGCRLMVALIIALIIVL